MAPQGLSRNAGNISTAGGQKNALQDRHLPPAELRAAQPGEIITSVGKDYNGDNDSTGLRIQCAISNSLCSGKDKYSNDATDSNLVEAKGPLAAPPTRQFRLPLQRQGRQPPRTMQDSHEACWTDPPPNDHKYRSIDGADNGSYTPHRIRDTGVSPRELTPRSPMSPRAPTSSRTSAQPPTTTTSHQQDPPYSSPSMRAPRTTAPTSRSPST